MNGVLKKRILRDLKANAGRYLALNLLIVLGVYIIVSMVGAAETVITGTENQKSVNSVEDGDFTTFLPLTEDEINTLTSDGTIIENMFYTDLKADSGKRLRLMKNREQIDLIQLDEGRLAENKGEAVLEKRYSEDNEISCGDTVKAGGVDFTIVGIGTVPDYDMPVASFSDTAVESSSFGLLFVTKEQYEYVRENTEQNAEEYLYAYRLGKTTDSELKEKIKSFDFDYERVNDKYFRETISDILDERKEIEDGVNDLYEGSRELSDGLSELDENSGDLKQGADDLFSAYLSEANEALNSMGQNVDLTKENYSEKLAALIKATDSSDLKELKNSLDSLNKFCEGIDEYTDGVASAYDGSTELSDGVSELKDKTDELLDKIFDIEINNLTSFVTADKNIRIAAAAGDMVMNKVLGLIAGVIALVLFTYVISVFVVHQIERESSVIGALYALGVKKRDLLVHYVTLPVVVAFAGGVIGTALGFSPVGAALQMHDSYGYYSLPLFEVAHPAYLLVYGLVLPPIICVIVNIIVINQKLSRTALSLIKNEQKASSYRQVNLKTKNFIRLFQIRQLLRESRSAITIVLGMFLAMLIVAMGLNCYVMCTSVKVDNAADTHYEYMYIYKYPEKTIPNGGESAYVETLSIDCNGYTLDVSVIGLNESSKYFDASPEKGKNKAVINNSLAERYGLKKGDKLTLNDSAEDTDYTFTVSDITKYSPGFTIFMDIDSMRELFGEDDDYFNVIYSDKKLDIDEGRLYSVTTKADVEKSSEVFVNLMMPMITMLVSVSIVIFCIVMYLMMAVMIDRSSFGISLIKIFGYRTNEIRKLYINGNTIVVAVGAMLCIPLGKKTMDLIYPYMISNVACSMNLHYPWYLYIGLYAAIMIIYFIVNCVLVRKIDKITPAEVLKNRE